MKLTKQHLQTIVKEFADLGESNWLRSCIELAGFKKFSELSPKNMWILFYYLSDVLYGIKEQQRISTI